MHKSPLALLLLVSVGAAVAPPAIAASALYVSPTGSDSNPGTATSPFATIQRASTAAAPGTTVYVAPGTYVGDTYVTAPGVTYQSVLKWGAVLVPPKTTATQMAFWNDHAANVTIDGFLIDGGGANAGQWSWGIYCAATNCTIRNNQVINIATANPAATNGNGGAGVEIDGYYGDTGGSITNNVIGNVGMANPDYNTIHCMYLATYGTKVTNNIVSGCHEGFGIESWHGASHLTIANNLIFRAVRGIQIGSGDVGGQMYAGGNDYSMVFNNIVYDAENNGGTIIGVSEQADPSSGGLIGSHNQYSNNCVSVADAWDLAVSTHVNDANGTPTFLNYQPDGSGDYRLANGSYCTDRGTSSLGGQPAPATAFDGVARPVGPAYDIGPYEGTNTVAVSQMWNPAHASNRIGMVSEAALALAANWTNEPVYASLGFTSGKYYWEAELTGAVAADLGVGVGNASAGTADDAFLGYDKHSAGYYADGSVWYNGKVVATLVPWTPGTRICVALDLVNHKIWVRLGPLGNWLNGDPATNTGGYKLPSSIYASAVTPGIGLYTPTDGGIGYFSPSSWLGQPPTGFGAMTTTRLN